MKDSTLLDKYRPHLFCCQEVADVSLIKHFVRGLWSPFLKHWSIKYREYSLTPDNLLLYACEITDAVLHGVLPWTIGRIMQQTDFRILNMEIVSSVRKNYFRQVNTSVNSSE